MAERQIYVVLTRDKGLFLVEPHEEMNQRDTIEAALGFGGGYSAGKVFCSLPVDATEAWAAWVTGEDKQGRPYYMLRAFPATLPQEEVEQQLAAQGEEWVKLNQGPIYRVDRPMEGAQKEPEAQEFQPG